MLDQYFPPARSSLWLGARPPEIDGEQPHQNRNDDRAEQGFPERMVVVKRVNLVRNDQMHLPALRHIPGKTAEVLCFADGQQSGDFLAAVLGEICINQLAVRVCYRKIGGFSPGKLNRIEHGIKSLSQ